MCQQTLGQPKFFMKVPYDKLFWTPCSWAFWILTLLTLFLDSVCLKIPLGFDSDSDSWVLTWPLPWTLLLEFPLGLDILDSASGSFPPLVTYPQTRLPTPSPDTCPMLTNSWSFRSVKVQPQCLGHSRPLPDPSSWHLGCRHSLMASCIPAVVQLGFEEFYRQFQKSSILPYTCGHNIFQIPIIPLN